MQMEIKDGKVIIPVELYEYEKEFNYLVFVLGYDLLNDTLNNKERNDCDFVYGFCNYLLREFMKSDEYRNYARPTYENLDYWIDKNKDYINAKYDEFASGYYTNYNNMKIMSSGFKNNEPVALIKKESKYKKEYIIAFDYKIKNNELIWRYGHYYRDIKDAFQDYTKVLSDNKLVDKIDNEKDTVKELNDVRVNIVKNIKKDTDKER